MKKLIIFCFTAFLATALNAQITITPGGTPETIIDNLIGTGVQVSNVVINCGSTSYGTFTGNLNAGGVGLSNGGIVLTTGSAAGADGPNTTGSSGIIVPGFDFPDPQLTTQPGSGNPPPSNDNCILQFDMIPACGSINLAFVFGSEEYPEFVTGAFNDGFGIFVTGPNPDGGTYNNFNMARLPNDQLVSIDNVNANTNSNFYNTNTAGIMQYDGYTDGLLASVNTVPCETYSIKIIIADAGDQIYDSGLFLGLESFACDTPPFTVTPNITNATCGPNGSATVSVTGGVGPFIYSWSGVTGQPTDTNAISNVQAGTYSVTVTDQGLCNATTVVPIQIINSQPIVTATATSSSICLGSNTTINALNGANYLWSPSTGLNTTTGSSVIATPSVSTTYTVTSELDGCIQTVNVPITVIPIPTITVENTTICAGQSASLSAIPSISGGTYLWTPGNFTGSVINVSPTTTTTYTPQYTLNGCTSPANSATVLVNPVPVVSVSDAVICAGEEATLTATADIAGGTFAWSNGANSQSIDITPASTTSLNVTYTVNNCTSTPAVADITVNPLPSGSLSSNSPICEGEDLSISASVFPDATWSWTGPDNFSSIDQNPFISAANSTASGTYTVDVTSNNCTASFSLEVSVISNIPSTIDPIDALCIDSDAIDLNSVIEPGIWSGNGIINSSIGLFDPATAGLGNHLITFDSDASCSSPFSITIEVTEFVDATITDVNPVCVTSEPIQLVAATPGGIWSGTCVNSLGLFTPSIVGAGNAQITYSINDVCTGQDQITIQVVAVPDIVFNTPAQICIDAPTVLLNATPIGGLWVGNGVVFAGFTPADAGVGPHTLTYEVIGICTASEEVSINVNPLPTVVASADQAICAGATTTISASGAATYLWFPSGSSPTNAFNNVTPNNTTTYTVTGTSAAGCQNSDQVVVTVNTLPTVTATASSTNICEGESVQLFGSGLTSYQWTPATILNTFNVANPIATPFGTETYTVSGTDANGCSGTASVTVSMTILDLILNGIEVGNPANTFDDSYVISGSSPFQIDFDVISNGVDFGWDFSGDSIPDLFGANIPNQIFSSPGVQGMLIAELGNCSDTIFFIVDLFSNSFIEIIPNVITPNGDGLNDRFYVKANDIETFDLKIYNRNGQLLATISDIDEIAQPVDSFDTWAPRGEFNDGTYMYVYLAKGKDGQEFKGSGTLTVLGSE